ncbi:MAG: hypothetical protein ACFFCW_10335 [Candidatus Hodarchaeota archaeon]
MRIVFEQSLILTGRFTRLLLPIRMDSEAIFKPSKRVIQPGGYEVVKDLLTSDIFKGCSCGLSFPSLNAKA